MHRKQNICQIVFGFKSTLTPCTFSFSSFFPFLFLPHIFLLDIKPGFIFGRKGVLENFCDYRIRRNIVQVDSGWVVVTVFCIFLWSVERNHAHLGMVRKISSPCSKLLVTVKTYEITSGRRDVHPYQWLWVVQVWMG